ncbi:30S ribosomal protein S18 [Actinorugispora endophytica]|uniref:Small ribosomal subunit protein bS18 n=1 Tax=Actinorugispora endophytica TaxID=1605990 RepID=A0A4R6V3S9_9ACTN|nr:30S ribosomal protein S18 [Actinorugispora endophytica]TDQ53265.1 SSU ribosomal protein S18P [Actinorugispora endophytica]
MPSDNRRTDRRFPSRRFANPLGELDYVDYKDVALLRTFVSEKGKIRSRRVTRVTARQQRLITAAVKNAREMALLPYPSNLPHSRS